METDIKDILIERGSRYGEFKRHAEITMMLKDTVDAYSDALSADQCEALDMIMHKVGRILNGDPNYVDSWVDIAGYAKLVADRLEKEQKEKYAMETRVGSAVGGSTISGARALANDPWTVRGIVDTYDAHQ